MNIKIEILNKDMGSIFFDGGNALGGRLQGRVRWVAGEEAST